MKVKTVQQSKNKMKISPFVVYVPTDYRYEEIVFEIADKSFLVPRLKCVVSP